MRRPFWLAAPSLLASLLAALPAWAAPAVDLAAHRAVYRLTLESSRGGITAAGGTMAFELTDACIGWATRQRLRITASTNEGRNIEIGSDYATLETKDSRSLRFNMRQTTDGAVTAETEGEARLSAGAGEARYIEPEETTKPLPAGATLPNQHTIAIIEAARAGKKFLTLPLFDGTSAKGAQDTSIAIFGWDPPKPHKFEALSKLPSARMRIAFFDQEKGNTTPDYELGIRYWENGIADDILMDFGEFVMKAVLTELAVLPDNC